MQLINCGTCLKTAQCIHKVSTEQLAQDLGVSRHQVYRWRNMENWKVHTLIKVCNLFGMTLKDFSNLHG
jgi:DNA-binding phage protein